MPLLRSVCFFLFASVSLSTIHAQALSAASRGTDLSAFYGVTRSDSGLKQGHATGTTLAVDAVVAAHPRYAIAAEARTTTPLSGDLVSESNAAGGVRVSTIFRALRPYLDVLYGRAQLDYAGDGMNVPGSNVMYTQSRSSIYMLGFGANFDLTQTLSIRLDQQFERMSMPVTATGHSTAMPMTFGVAYRLPYLKHGHAY